MKQYAVIPSFLVSALYSDPYFKSSLYSSFAMSGV